MQHFARRSTKSSHNLINFKLSSSVYINFVVPYCDEQLPTFIPVSQPTDLATVLERNTLPILVNIDEPEDRKVSIVKIGGINHTAGELGNILIIDKYEANYLKMNCIYNDDSSDLRMNDTACMLAFTKEITLTPILGFKYRTDEDYKQLVRRLDKQVAHHPEQYDKTDGNPNWTEFNLQQNQEDNGIPIQVKILPVDVIKIIKFFQTEPLPPPPPSPLSTPSGVPPPRPQKTPNLKPQTQEKQKDDADYDSDYEIPDIDNFPIPAPKLPERKPSIRKLIPMQTKEKSKFKLKNVLRKQPLTGLEVHESVSGQKDSGNDKTKIGRAVVRQKPLTGLEVHESVSGQKDSGNDKTKIGRAVVRPQPKLPEVSYDDVAYDLYSQVYVVPGDEREEPTPDHSNSTKPATMPTGLRQQSAVKEQASPNITRSISQSAEAEFAGVSDLSIAEVGEVLKELSLGTYADSFRRNTIDGAILCELEMDDFINELGLKKLEAVRLSKYVKTGHIPK